ncbi:hypothetical protein JIR001_09670 [Polycladomyces abyssicola]|uniref:Uncharacterized protein n=1 Tax=Polycladomyces abyssicola TaxID=1125966 RepID=A0A8D5UDS5_9BACL|nr:hypothetical protein JIR001_09670 [Polycladomyces abyssicola]
MNGAFVVYHFTQQIGLSRRTDGQPDGFESTYLPYPFCFVKQGSPRFFAKGDEDKEVWEGEEWTTNYHLYQWRRSNGVTDGFNRRWIGWNWTAP